VGFADRGDLFGGARGDHQAASVSALGAEVDQAVGAFDHVEVVLDHDNRVAGVDQPLENLEQPLNVGEVQSGRRLVEDVERAAGRDLRQLGRQLDALGLAAGQRRRWLTEADVAEADVVERLRRRWIDGMCSKKTTASSTGMSSTSAIVLPLKRTSSVSRL
jgi:hypothetical protein